MSDHLSFPSLSFCFLYSLLVVALFQLCLSNQNSNDVLCMDVERKALLRFKHGLVDEADRLASWVGEESNCCKWAGIVCDNFTGHVHQINLRGLDGHCHYWEDEFLDLKQKLKGELSPSLLDLKQLEVLDLSCNDFGGIKVPNFIGSLRNLKYLNLSNSEFAGIIPPQLGNLSELNVLCLGGNFLSTSMQWLSSLRLLHHLDMSHVNLSLAGDWLQVINTLPSLVQLRFSNTQLPDIHPNLASHNLTSLSLLDLSRNDFADSSVLRWIFSITSLVSLDLGSFDGPIPSSLISFRNLTSLEFLHVRGNDFMGSSSVLEGLSSDVGSNLISLDISGCGISSSALNALHNLTSLLSLDLSYNQLTKTIPKSLCNLCNLKDIDLSYNHDFHNISLTYLLESFFECKSPSLESLSLRYSQLSGRLPNQLGRLIHLVHLLLSDNNITGMIPHSIGQLSNLTTLSLSGNLISGPIPYSFGSLSLLEVLDLSYNRLNGSIPDSIGRLSLLEKLDLSYNRLTGSIPDSIGRLSLLEVLNLSGNRLNGSIPDSLGQLSKLNVFDVSYNLLTGVITEAFFAKLVSLKRLRGEVNSITLRLQLANWIPPFQIQYLSLHSWVLGPQFPLWLQSQRDLVSLEISNTGISSPMPDSFLRSFPMLQYLDMSQNQIRGTLSSIPATLEILSLSSNMFTGRLPNLSNSSLVSLDLSNNSFAGSLHHSLCPYDDKFLNFLHLGNNYFSGTIPGCWKKWPRLSFLNLENNNLSGGIPRTLGFSDSLLVLSLHKNKLSGRLPASLMNLTNLEILQLGGNELVGSIPKRLGTELSFLRILNLRSNNFDGNIPHELCYLTHIQILDLAHNNLSGNIPKCINNFSVFSGKEAVSIGVSAFSLFDNGTTVAASDSLVMKGREDTYSTILSLVTLLDLSNNNFSGHIPDELTALRKLESLNLSSNQFTGSIPEKIGDMSSLETFDLSRNKFSGELPMSLARLTFLNSVNVSYNSLTGRVPSSTQLQSLPESSFVGNKLCGAPLIELCAVEAPGRNKKEERESHGTELGLIISMLIGFGTGFWIIVAPLIVSRSWRIAYFRYWDKMRYTVYDIMRKYSFGMFSK